MSNMQRDNRVRSARLGGFTFVELLATVVLIGIIMPVAMRTISLCTRLAGQSRREIEAVSLASTKLSELVASKDWETGGRGGDFGTDWPGYQWNAEVSNWTESTVRQLDVEVLWTSQGRQRQVTLSTLVYPEEE
jgi:type II secretory pathway pseudopilin PulG